jgi:IMP dehydrogenase
MNKKQVETALTYDDIQLIPRFSGIESRKNIDLSTQFTRNYKLVIPVLASPMDTICEYEMAIAMAEVGGAGAIHRFMSIEKQASQVEHVRIQFDFPTDNLVELWGPLNQKPPVVAAIGMNGDYLARAETLIDAGVNVLLIDVAHGYHTMMKEAIDNIKEMIKVTHPYHPWPIDIIAGNIATAEAGRTLTEWGADALRVGIGGGSLCTTRLKTGFGVPNVTSIEDVVRGSTRINNVLFRYEYTPIIACGGIRSSGDIAKALAVGADTVILGSLIAGTTETPGEMIVRGDPDDKDNTIFFKKYRGAASLETKQTHNQEARNVEGESTWVQYKGDVKGVIEELMDGLRSAFSYAGAENLPRYQANTSYYRVTNAGMVEAKPHLKY